MEAFLSVTRSQCWLINLCDSPTNYAEPNSQTRPSSAVSTTLLSLLAWESGVILCATQRRLGKLPTCVIYPGLFTSAWPETGLVSIQAHGE
jgi:hypothetical protein